MVAPGGLASARTLYRASRVDRSRPRLAPVRSTVRACCQSRLRVDRRGLAGKVSTMEEPISDRGFGARARRPLSAARDRRTWLSAAIPALVTVLEAETVLTLEFLARAVAAVVMMVGGAIAPRSDRVVPLAVAEV